MILSAGLLASGCAGGVGSTNADGGDGSGDGVAYGSTPAEYQEALADMEPIELTFQAGASSAENEDGKVQTAFAERVEELSGGKITLEIVWGTAIADYDQVTEAVADGRIDIGTELPIYNPSKYSAMSELINLAPGLPTTPYYTEIAASAALEEVAWNSADIMETYESMGVTVLQPARFGFSNVLMCAEPITTHDDFRGKQIRVGAETEFALAEGMGATPVSMAAGEAYEALQRNTVDCTFGGIRAGVDLGWLEVAPYIILPEEGAWGRNPLSTFAGPSFDALPLAAQQLIFDALATRVSDTFTGTLNATAEVIDALDEAGGEIYRIDGSSEKALQGVTRQLEESVSGSESDVSGEALTDAYEKWLGVASDEGLESDSDYQEFAESWEPDSSLLESYSDTFFREVYLPHRPGADE